MRSPNSPASMRMNARRASSKSTRRTIRFSSSPTRPPSTPKWADKAATLAPWRRFPTAKPRSPSPASNKSARPARSSSPHRAKSKSATKSSSSSTPRAAARSKPTTLRLTCCTGRSTKSSRRMPRSKALRSMKTACASTSTAPLSRPHNSQRWRKRSTPPSRPTIRFPGPK